jgi:hypothetical protein
VCFHSPYPLGLEKLKRGESSISIASFRKCLLSGDIDCSRYPLAVAGGNWCSNPLIRRGIPRTGLKPCAPSPVQPCDDSVPGLREPDSLPKLRLSSFNLHVHTGITQLLEHYLRNFVEIRLHGRLWCRQASYDFALTLTGNFSIAG